MATDATLVETHDTPDHDTLVPIRWCRALDLCERFGVKTTTARTGKFCLVAAALFGDPDVDLQYHCMKAISQKPAQKQQMYDAVQRDCPEKKLGREARAVRILTLLDEIPQKKLAAFDTADLLRRRLSLEEPVAVPLPLASNRGAAT